MAEAASSIEKSSISSAENGSDITVSAVEWREMANAIRVLAMDGVEKARSGHPGMPMGMADVATVLFSRFLKFNPVDPDWPDRDRFVLSAGHGSMLLYALLHLTGYADMSREQLENFRQLGSRTAGHPEYGHAAGIEMTTGPLGQGIASAVGMALAERLASARFGNELVDHYTYVIAGDGCLMEGISHEAIDLAGHLKLSKLIVLFDDNGISIDGKTELATSMDQPARFKAAGWDVHSVDGHDMEAIEAAITEARAADRPSLVACRTIIGSGAPNKQGSAATHGAPLGAAEIAATREALGWTSEPFEIPSAIAKSWHNAGQRCQLDYARWQARFAQVEPKDQAAMVDPLTPADVKKLNQAVRMFKADMIDDAPRLASRVSSQKLLDAIVDLVPGLVGGSADLTGSNGTLTDKHTKVSPGDFSGNYIHYGVREHAMAAVMNGIALHGGFIPYGGTFLAFADYSRPAIRLAALMGLRVVHVMTHDSIGLGEDGPTHQPVEHLAALRAIPNVNLFRPADVVETAECWQLALTQRQTPSILALTRQNLVTLRSSHMGHMEDNMCAHGAYLLRDVGNRRHATILASGSEVAIAIDAAELLAGEGRLVAVVSMPCWELFLAQPKSYRDSVLGRAPRVGVEAGLEHDWARWLGDDGEFVGMRGFGASAPADDLYRHFGITVEAVADAVRTCLRR